MNDIHIVKGERVIEFTEEEFKFVKEVIEQTLQFWADAKKESDEFPWELFDDFDPYNINVEAIKKLKQLGIDTYGL